MSDGPSFFPTADAALLDRLRLNADRAAIDPGRAPRVVRPEHLDLPADLWRRFSVVGSEDELRVPFAPEVSRPGKVDEWSALNRAASAVSRQTEWRPPVEVERMARLLRALVTLASHVRQRQAAASSEPRASRSPG